MAKYVDDADVAALQTKLQNRLDRAANVIVTGPGLGQTDECSVVVTSTIAGKLQHQDIEFTFGDRSIDEVVADLNRQIVLWMQRVTTDSGQ
jgi:hypothetical protein